MQRTFETINISRYPEKAQNKLVKFMGKVGLKKCVVDYEFPEMTVFC